MYEDMKLQKNILKEISNFISVQKYLLWEFLKKKSQISSHICRTGKPEESHRWMNRQILLKIDLKSAYPCWKSVTNIQTFIQAQ